MQLGSGAQSSGAGFVPEANGSAITTVFLVILLLFFLLRSLFSVTQRRAFVKHYSSTLISGNFKTLLDQNQFQNKEHVTRVENRIEEARAEKGLSTVHETYNEQTYMNDLNFAASQDELGGPALRRINSFQNQGNYTNMGNQNYSMNTLFMNTIEEETEN